MLDTFRGAALMSFGDSDNDNDSEDASLALALVIFCWGHVHMMSAKFGDFWTSSPLSV